MAKINQVQKKGKQGQQGRQFHYLCSATLQVLQIAVLQLQFWPLLCSIRIAQQPTKFGLKKHLVLEAKHLYKEHFLPREGQGEKSKRKEHFIHILEHFRIVNSVIFSFKCFECFILLY
ncbi:hypothetical protein PIB30_067862 [Stylosanthes scabra]|uniref:Uncharacterized protein n=1 Tax=Stylosanthes scabra TaxID=79078 RepID=A0ABU6VPH2_9FABA|nr:hypothetical protein [Stylosanthes scabra]